MYMYLAGHGVIMNFSSLWRHNGRNGDSNHQPHECLLNRSFRCRSKKTSKLRVTGLCAGNSPVTGEFPAQMARNAENVFIWWRHHVIHIFVYISRFADHEVPYTYYYNHCTPFTKGLCSHAAVRDSLQSSLRWQNTIWYIDGLVPERRNSIALAWSYVFLALTHRYLHFLLFTDTETIKEDKDISISQGQCHGWWCAGDGSNQSFSSHSV